MARFQEIVKCEKGRWTELSDADVTEISFEALNVPIYVRVTDSPTEPTERVGFSYPAFTGESCIGLDQISKLPGAIRLWAQPVDADFANVIVDQA